MPQSQLATIGPLQDNRPLFHYVIGISEIFPYNKNLTLQTLLSFDHSRFFPPAQYFRTAL